MSFFWKNATFWQNLRFTKTSIWTLTWHFRFQISYSQELRGIIVTRAYLYLWKHTLD